MLVVPPTTLLSWNRGFDEDLKPLIIPERRGKTATVTVDMVRRIVEHAKGYQGRRIRLKAFGSELREKGIDLSSKTIEAILIANDLYKASIRRKRPAFYQSLCQKLPNGLLSIDGSEVVVWLGDTEHAFNVELAVDVATFAHTAFSVDDSETADAVIKVLDAHRHRWGIPIGVLGDCGSANDSGSVQRYLYKWDIKRVPAGPGNPKGNGTDEGAFSQMKNALGRIRIDATSPKALARSVLETLVALYVQMRNRLPVHLRGITPRRHMEMPALVPDQVPELGTLQVGGVHHQPTLVVDGAGQAAGFEKLTDPFFGQIGHLDKGFDGICFAAGRRRGRGVGYGREISCVGFENGPFATLFFTSQGSLAQHLGNGCNRQTGAF